MVEATPGKACREGEEALLEVNPAGAARAAPAFLAERTLTMSKINATASNPRPTSTGVERGIDVDVNVTVGEAFRSASVTLLPAEDGRPVYEAWGAPDHWLDGGTLRVLRALDHDTYRAALNAIEAAASRAAGRPS